MLLLPRSGSLLFFLFFLLVLQIKENATVRASFSAVLVDGDTNPDRVGCSVASSCQRRALTESVSGTRQRLAGKPGELIKNAGIGLCDGWVWLGL